MISTGEDGTHASFKRNLSLHNSTFDGILCLYDSITYFPSKGREESHKQAVCGYMFSRSADQHRCCPRLLSV